MNAAVFCGSGFGADEKYARAAAKLGRTLALRGHRIVFGASDAGLMGELAGAALEAGGRVTGISTGDIAMIRDQARMDLDELIVAADMSERKHLMFERADVAIALPGGIGTLDEMSELITLVKLGKYRCKCVFLDVDGYWKPLQEMLDAMVREEFLRKEELKHVLFSEDVEEIFRFAGL